MRKKIKIINHVTISEANQNFSAVARKVEEQKDLIIMKNSKPLYRIQKLTVKEIESIQMAELIK